MAFNTTASEWLLKRISDRSEFVGYVVRSLVLPDRFESFDHALDCSHQLVVWYHKNYLHTNLGLLTPAVVHSSAARRNLNQRRVVLEEIYVPHPE